MHCEAINDMIEAGGVLSAEEDQRLISLRMMRVSLALHTSEEAVLLRELLGGYARLRRGLLEGANIGDGLFKLASDAHPDERYRRALEPYDEEVRLGLKELQLNRQEARTLTGFSVQDWLDLEKHVHGSVCGDIVKTQAMHQESREALVAQLNTMEKALVGRALPYAAEVKEAFGDA